MNYKFPIINNISDVLPAIEDSDEFIVVAKDGGYTVVNYVVTKDDTFPLVTDELSAIRRECRGLIFDTKTGNIKSRRFHKFFNCGEREETLLPKIDVYMPHDILEKLDGMMITPLEINGHIRWATKMGITDYSLFVEDFVYDNLKYLAFAKHIVKLGLTPIFEFCSRKNRIVIDYPEDSLVLLAIRNNVTGRYTPYEKLSYIAGMWDIDCVKVVDGTIENMAEFVKSAAAEEDHEGYVIRFFDGHCVKVKNQWYVNLHRTKDAISRERNLVTLILNDQLDDLKPFLSEEDAQNIRIYTSKFWQNLELTIKVLKNLAQEYIGEEKMTRKDFALWSEIRVKNGLMSKFERGIMFRVYDGKLIREELTLTIKANLGNEKKFSGVRPLFGHNLEWKVHS